MDRRLQRQLEEDPVLEAATDWFVEMQGADVPVERVLEWQNWCKSDERHRAAYRSIEALWGAVESVTPQLWPPAEQVKSDRYDPKLSISAWRAGRSRHVLRYSLAASVLIAAALGMSQWSAVRNWLAPSAVTVQTQTGERREVRLSDGSIITIGGRSVASASITPQMRIIRLESGEAYFDVAKDPSRPFIVRAGGTAVTAIGTQFNVRQSSDHIVVSVADGVVQVDRALPGSKVPANQPVPASTVRLVAGEQLSVPNIGAVDARQPVDARAVGGWRSGQLHYIDEPLATVVADVRRYSARRIEIADPPVGQFRITGTVFENDVESWLRTLEAAFPVRAITDARGTIVLRSAAESK